MIIHGINPITEALTSDSQSLERIWIVRGKSNSRLNRIVRLARARGVPVRFDNAEIIKQKAATSRHQDVAAQIGETDYVDLETVLKTGHQILLLIDGVEDPRNLGALLRTAEAVGVGAVLVPKRRNCGLTPAVVKCSAGAALHLKIARIGNVAQILKRLKKEGFWIVGLDVRGTHSMETLEMSFPLVVVVGGEHRGVRPLVRKQCDFLVSLPMRGRVSSLNLSVAAGVLLYHMLLKGEADPPA